MATSASASASAPAPASTHQHLHSLQLLRQLLSLSQLNHINTPPSNSPTLSLPSSLSLRAAINSLLTNRCLSAPLIDPNSSRLIGTFSLADALHFICLLHPPQNHALISRPCLNPSPLQVSIPSDPSLFSLPLSTLTDLRPCSPPHSFHLNSDSTLLEAAQQLSRSHLSRLPIVDRDRLSGNDSLSSILSPLTLLRYISTHPAADIDRLSQSIGSLRIGSYLSNTQFPRSLTTPIQIESHSLLAATEQHCLRDIARILLDRAVGAVPIVDQEGSMVDIYELVDLVDLLASPKPPQHPFDLTVHQALSLRTRKVTGITFCSSKDSLGSLLKYLAKNTVHLFVMVENVEGGEPLTGRPSRTRKASKRSKTVKDRLVGVLSLGDILDHLISFQSGHHCAPYDTASATQPLPIVSANTSTYSSSLVSCSSNTSSVSFFSPTTTLHSTSAPNHSSMPARTHASHLHTPLSLRIASYPSSLTQPLLDTSHVSSTHLTNQPSWSAGPCLAASSRQSPNASYRSICKHPPVPATYHLPASRTSTELRTPDQTPSPSVVPVRPPPPPMNKIAEFAAQMMCYLWFAEPLSLQRTSSVAQSLRLNEDRLSRFGGSGAAADGDDHGTQIGRAAAAASGTGTSITQAQLVPNPEFVMFIHNLLSTTQVSHSVVLLALFYIHRLKCLNPIKPNSKSEYRIGVVSLMLANKMLDDHTYTAKTWSEVSRLPLISLNDGEIEFLQGLDFELHVNIRDFSAWFRLLHGMVNLKDHHTALVLASGPRTRWFKKMRVASGEGLSVLEGLVSPLRESKIMKGEAEKERQGAASANRPSHPYNLRRAARVSSTTAAGPVARPTRGAVQQIASWGNTVYDRGMSYGASVAVTPQQQVEFGERQIASMPTKSRSTMHQPTRPSRMNMGSKRSASEYLEQEVDGPARKRVASALVAMPSVPMPAPVHSTRLPPIMLAQPGHSGTYLGTAIVPCSQNGALGGGNGGGAELYFRTLAAGRRGTGHGAEAARQGQVVCQAPQQQEGAAGVFVFGSEPWRRQQQGQDQGQGGDEWRWYSNFSNAGVPGVVWADMSRANLSGAGGQQVQTVRQQQQQVQHTRQQQQLLHHHHHHHQQLQQHLQQQQQQQQQQQVQIASIGNDSTRRTTGVGQSQVQRGY